MRELDSNPLDLIEGHLIASPIVEAGRSSRFMRGRLLGDLQPSIVLEIGCDVCRAERMATDLGLDSSPRARWRIIRHTSAGAEHCPSARPIAACCAEERTSSGLPRSQLRSMRQDIARGSSLL